MSDFTPAEIQSYSAMQARLVSLLLRHDQRWFSRFYTLHPEFTTETDALRRYRELAVLFHLRDEFFEHILPRIVRRLSFESPRDVVIEEPPARGRVDWERTLAATWDERPGETPLLVSTRLRRRDFATPENLLVVATLLEYRSEAQRLLWDEHEAIGLEALRHPLNEIVERCERELQFPQFAGLRHRAQYILNGEEGGPDALEARVQDNAAPGANSAYDELLQWRAKLRALELLRRTPTTTRDDLLGADPDRDNYLYQLWIFFELADLLQQEERLRVLDTTPGRMCMEFSWGKGDDQRLYKLRHDQKVPEPVAKWGLKTKKGFVPGVRPDFYLYRIDPQPQRVEHMGAVYWCEPGVVWDAKYYREREQPRAPSSPIKRMIADLQLLGEQYGMLLFAFLKDGTGTAAKDGADGTRVIDDEAEDPSTSEYGLLPEPGFDQTLAQEQEVWVRALTPAQEAGGATRGALYKLLGEADKRLKTPRVPACYGTFLDPLSTGDGHLKGPLLVDRYGEKIPADPSELLLCPKPHIGPWRVDLVSRRKHCCEDGRLCQIIGQPGKHKPLRPPRKPEELVKELQRLFEGKGELDAAEMGLLAHQVESLARNLADFTGASQRMDVYYQRLRDLGMRRTLALLSPQEQESLGLAVFLVEQLDLVKANDYSAPAIQITRVIEGQVVDKVFKCPGLVGRLREPRDRSLGSLPIIATYPHSSEGNWERVAAYAAARWDGRIDPERPLLDLKFVDFATALEPIRRRRNDAAHPHPFSRDHYSELQTISLQAGPLGIGTLNAFLLSWQEH